MDKRKGQAVFGYVLEIETAGWGLLSIRKTGDKRRQLIFCAGTSARRSRIELSVKPATKISVCLITIVGVQKLEITIPGSSVSVDLGYQPCLDRLKMMPTSRTFPATLISHPAAQIENPIRFVQNALTLQNLVTLRDFAWQPQDQYPVRIDCSNSQQRIQLIIDQRNKFDTSAQLYKISMTKS